MAMQPIQLSGIVRGKTILLEGELGLPDGAQVSLTVTVERVPNAKTVILARSPSELPPEVWDMVDTAISEWDRLDREAAASTRRAQDRVTRPSPRPERGGGSERS